jgi:hypothetical protein
MSEHNRKMKIVIKFTQLMISLSTLIVSYNAIDQVSEFKYLGYLISDYKSDLEYKIQTYNKINGVIRRHFGKQMTKETKLRIHNITAKAAIKFGSEAWVLKK